MSVLHSLPATALASSKAASNSTAPAEAVADAPFETVLSALLGLSNSPQLAALLPETEQPAPEKSPPHSLSDETAADAATNVSALALALPVLPIQGQILNGDAAQTKEAAAGAATRSVARPIVLEQNEKASPSAAAERLEMPAVVTPDTQSPASFAAALQSLPVKAEETPRQDHPVVHSETTASSPEPAVPATVAEPRAEAARPPAEVNASVPLSLQDSRWGDAFSERVVWMTSQHVQSAEIHVEPAHLGPIEVRISITNDQANLLFTRPACRGARCDSNLFAATPGDALRQRPHARQRLGGGTQCRQWAAALPRRPRS